MAIEERIYELPAGTAVTDTSNFPNEDSANANVTQKLTGLQLATYLAAKIGGGFLWQTDTSSPVALTAGSGHIANLGTLLSYSLPVTAAVGDSFVVLGLGAGGWRITQNASQLIHIGNVVTTTGVGGSVSSSNQFDCITVTCVVANTTFNAYGIQGNLTTV